MIGVSRLIVILVLLRMGTLSLSDAQPTLLWRYQTGSGVQASPAALGDYVYIGSNDGYLYCLHSTTGALKWRVNSGGAISSRPAFFQGALAAAGTSSATQTVLFGSANNNFYAVDADTGQSRWSYTTGDKIQSSPVVHDSLKLVFFGSDDLYLYALNIMQGTLAWRKSIPATNGNNQPRGTPVLDGSTLFLKTHYDLFSIAASSGVENWKRSESSDSNMHSHDDPHYTPAVLGSTVYWGGRSGVFGLAASTGASYQFTGSPQPSDECGSPVLLNVTATAQTLLFVGSSGSGGINAYALTGGTNRLWSKTACGSNSAIIAPPAASQRHLYLGSSSSFLCALSIDTGATAWTFSVGGAAKTQPLLFKKNIYFGADDNYVYAITDAQKSRTQTLSLSADGASASRTISLSSSADGASASKTESLSLSAPTKSRSKSVESPSIMATASAASSTQSLLAVSASPSASSTNPSRTASLSMPVLPTPSTLTAPRLSTSASLTMPPTRSRSSSISATPTHSISQRHSQTRTVSTTVGTPTRSPTGTDSSSPESSLSRTTQRSASHGSLSFSADVSRSLTNSTLLLSDSSSVTATSNASATVTTTPRTSTSTSQTASESVTESQRTPSLTRGTATKTSECGTVLAWAMAADSPTATPPLLRLVRFHPHSPVVPVGSTISALAMPGLSAQRTQQPILYNITVGIVMPFKITAVSRHDGRRASNITFITRPYAPGEDVHDGVTRSQTPTYDGDDEDRMLKHHTLVFVSFMLAPTNLSRIIRPRNESGTGSGSGASEGVDNSTVDYDTDSWVDFILNATCKDDHGDEDESKKNASSTDDAHSDKMAVHWVYRVLITDPPADPPPNFTAVIPKIVLSIGSVTSTIMSNPSGGTTLSKIAAAERAAECRELEPSEDEQGLTGVDVGDDGFSTLRGSVVEALLLCVVCLVLWYLMIAVLRFVVYPYRTVSRIQAVLHWPSVTVMPAATQLQPSILSALSIALTTGAAGDVALISITVFAWLLYLFWWWGALYAREFPCELVTRGSVEDTNEEQITRDSASKTAPQTLSTADRTFMSFIEGSVHWHVKPQFARGGGMDWKLCYYFLFKDFRNRWYALLDAVLTTVVVVVAGIPLSSKGLCNFQLAVITLAYAVLVVALVWQRAALGGLDMAYHLLVNACGLVSSAALLLWSNLGDDYLQETFRIATSISIGAILIHGAADVLLLLMALPHVHRQLRMSASSSELDAALLVSTDPQYCLLNLSESNINREDDNFREDGDAMFEEMLEVNLNAGDEVVDDEEEEIVVDLGEPNGEDAADEPLEDLDTRDLDHTELARLEELRKARDILAEFYEE